MKFGKQPIYDLPINDITSLGAFAQQLEREARARGEDLPLAVRLHIGEPSFRTPEHIRLAAMRAIESEPLTYGPPPGWPWLRELIAEKIRRVNGYSVTPDNIGVAMGGTGAILSAMVATVGQGDEVLIPDPHWPQYTMQLACCGAVAVPYPLYPQQGWLPDVAQLEQLITPRTRMLIINSPANPTGAVFPPELISELLDFALRHDLYLLSDECYDEIVFEGTHVSPATMLTPDEFNQGNLICVYTLSETYAMTGWRIGYVVTGTQLMKSIADVLNASYTNVSTIAQRAAEAALTGPQECVTEMRNIYRKRRDRAVSLLKDYGRYLYTPHGAFYILVNVAGPGDKERDGREFAFNLLRKRNITVGPGSGFGSMAKQYVRVSLSASDEEIERGIKEICEFANR